MSGYICKSCRISMQQTLRSHQIRLPISRSISRTCPSTINSLDINDIRPMGRAADSDSKDISPANDGLDEKAVIGGAVDHEVNDDKPILNEENTTIKPKPPIRKSKRELINVKSLLAKPTWSVRSLLPPDKTPPRPQITVEKLNHLLRLSALPLPRRERQQKKMLEVLESQLHFVRNIRKVNTDGVEPLRSIRDETEEGMKEITIGMAELKDAFAKEDIVGKNRRPRRRREVVDTKGVEDWDVFGAASETVEANGARYFVVRKSDGPEGWKGCHLGTREEEDAKMAETVGKDGAAEIGSEVEIAKIRALRSAIRKSAEQQIDPEN